MFIEGAGPPIGRAGGAVEQPSVKRSAGTQRFMAVLPRSLFQSTHTPVPPGPLLIACPGADPRRGDGRPPRVPDPPGGTGGAARRDREVGRGDPAGPPPQRGQGAPPSGGPLLPQDLRLFGPVAPPDRLHRLARGPRVPEPAPDGRARVPRPPARRLGPGADARVRERELPPDPRRRGRGRAQGADRPARR